MQNPVSASGVPGQDPTGATADDDLDLVRVGLSVSADGGVTAAVTVKALSDAGPSNYPGDYFLINFTAGGAASSVALRRDDFVGGVRRATIKGTTTVLGKAAVYDVKTNTVTAVFTPDQVKAAFGKPLQGVVLAGFSALAYGYTDTGIYDSPTTVGGLGFPLSDQAPAPTTLSYTDAGGCGDAGGAPAPTGSGTPSGTPTATASATPSGTPSPGPTGAPGAFEEAPFALPRAGCQLFTDGPGDGTPTLSAPAAFGNDPDLDISSVSVKTTATQLIALIKVATLGDLPAKPVNGDQFQFEFKLNGKTFNYAAGRVDQVAGGASVAPNRAQLNGTAEPKLKYTSAFDKPKSTVSLLIDRAALESVAGAPASVGTVLTGVKAVTKGYLVNQTLSADTAQAAAAADQVYTVGDNVCFFPPAAKMEWLGEDTVTGQYGDLVEAAVGLSTDDDAPLDGRAVIFTLGTATVTGTTDADGVADVFLPALAAGTTKVTAAFAGDADNYKTALDYAVVVKAEVTKLTLAVTKAGTARTVTATLVDDDKPKANPIAGQALTVLVNGKKVGTVKTDVKGKAVWKTAKIGQTVKFSLAAVAGQYATASAQQKLA